MSVAVRVIRCVVRFGGRAVTQHGVDVFVWQLVADPLRQ
jgi:hypothetical protein